MTALRLLPLAAFCLSIPVLVPAATEVNALAARVNESVITESEVNFILRTAELSLRVEHGDGTKAYKEAMAKAREQVLQNLIDAEILLSEFNEKGGALKDQYIDDEINTLIREEYGGDRKKFFAYLQRSGVTNRRYREMTRKRLIVQLMRSQVTREVSPPTEEEVRAEYQKMVGEMREKGGAVKFKRISVPKASATATPEQQLAYAREIRTKIEQGADFAALADQIHGPDSTAPRGGDWPAMQRSHLKEDLAQAAFSTPVGSLSPVLDTERSYDILLVEAREAPEVPPYAELYDQARRRAEVKKRSARYQEYIDELRRKAVVKRY